MTKLLTIIPWSTATLFLLLYLFLLLDEWRIRKRARVALTAASFLTMTAVLLSLPPEYHYFAAPPIYLLLFVVTLLCAAKRDCRYLFAFLSALLLSSLSAALCSMLSPTLLVFQLLLRIPVDGGLLLLCRWFFRPAFRSIHQMAHRQWGLLLPVPLCSMLALYLLSYRFPGSYFAMLGLISLVLAIYGLFAFLLNSLRHRHEGAIDTAMLQSQYATLSHLAEERNQQEYRRRILRHDLRHYTPLLDSSLVRGDTSATLALIAAMRGQLSNLDQEVAP